MRRIPLDKYKPSPEKIEHYKTLHIWLKGNKEIEFKKLIPFGFSINTLTIPTNKVDEFIKVCTFDEE